MLASLSVQISWLTRKSNRRSLQLKGLQLSSHFPFGLVEREAITGRDGVSSFLATSFVDKVVFIVWEYLYSCVNLLQSSTSIVVLYYDPF